MVEHTTTVQVRWGDADPAGIAFYPRFFEWYDIGTEALFASLGLAWPEAFPRYGIVGVPILEAGSRFISPVRYGDAVAVRTRVAWVRGKTFRVEHELSVGDDGSGPHRVQRFEFWRRQPSCRIAVVPL